MSKAGLAVWCHRITDFRDSSDIEKHADILAENGVNILIPCVKKNLLGAVDFLAVFEPFINLGKSRDRIEKCPINDISDYSEFCNRIVSDWFHNA